MTETYYTEYFDQIDPSVYMPYTIASLIIAVLGIAGLWMMFTKAGVAGWKAIIPIYNIVILFKIIGLNPWLVLLYLTAVIPVVGWFVTLGLAIVVASKTSTAFGHAGGYAIGLFFLTPIFYMILGFGNSEYKLNN